jgi:hypothetical protein
MDDRERVGMAVSVVGPDSAACVRMTDSMSLAPGLLDPRHIAARRVLLDALFALEPHKKAIVVAGAQAIYIRTGSADIGIAPFTTDGDLALNPSLLGDDPTLEHAMTSAGFHLLPRSDDSVEPGIWVAQTKADGVEIQVPVDLIVPEGFAPRGGRRGARLGLHGNRAARRLIGLEAALVDHERMPVESLEESDRRSIDIDVAGPAALLISKLHKVHDRIELEKADRLDDKDAADVVRVMQATSPNDVAATVLTLFKHEVAGDVTRVGLEYMRSLFGRRGQPGIEMASRALRIAVPAERVEAICVSYTSTLMETISEGL